MSRIAHPGLPPAHQPDRSRWLRCRRTMVAAVIGAALLAASCSSTNTTGAGHDTTSSPGDSSADRRPTALRDAATGLPLIRHVFVIMLENKSYDATFGTPEHNPYLATTLPSQGALLEQYYGTGHDSLTNYVALISGQAPNPATQGDCEPRLVAFPSDAGLDAAGQQTGTGCLYPSDVANLPDQLTAKGLTWKGYLQDMGNIPAGKTEPSFAPVCGTPGVDGVSVPTWNPEGDGYALDHNPFVFFQSIVESPICATNDVALGSSTGAMPPGTPSGVTGLVTDLQSAATTPNFVLISPSICYNGHDAGEACTKQKDEAGNPLSSDPFENVDAFLREWVPRITNSEAFKADGLLLVAYDEADIHDGGAGRSDACCGETPGPGSPQPGKDGPGGGRVGAVLLSPFIVGGTVSTVPYNHYGTLATIEQLFDLPRIGQAATTSTTFGTDIFG